ncbi:MAG: tRNA (N6-threonylcarbamoyladenosine(37)-N6)-methyltransferase TrmO [Acidobacteria bacterium]|nr:tRNA (N6-threonylcarbamoyladenosine(37)-N6)-methyltransferase TrmO [Acidobacteriota bacterium]
MATPQDLELSPIGYVRSALKQRKGAPRQAWEAAPAAKLEIDPAVLQGLEGILPGQQIWILTWLHEAQRDVLRVHPRGRVQDPEMGVFATRSPDRPNPVGLHRAQVLSIDEKGWIEVRALEAIDGTPIVDIKPVLDVNGGS